MRSAGPLPLACLRLAGLVLPLACLRLAGLVLPLACLRLAGLVLPLAGLLLSGPASGQPAPEDPGQDERTRIYGIELEPSPERDRLLVFADGLLRPKLQEVDRGTVRLSFPGARLDATAPRRLVGQGGGSVHQVTAIETTGAAGEVVLTVTRSAGVSPSLSQRGGQVALDFDRPGRVERVRPDRPPENTISLNGLDQPLDRLVEKLARFLGLRVILDQTMVKGQVSLEAPEPFTRDEARALLDTLLLLKGLAAVKGPADTYKIQPLATSPGPWVEALDADTEGGALLTLVRLSEVDAELVSQALEPLVGEQGLLQVHAPSNALLLGGAKSRLSRIAHILRTLDRQAATRVVLIPLRYASADTAADALEIAFESDSSFRVWPDPRIGRVVVRGRLGTIERVRDYLARIDRPGGGEGSLQVLPVQYADPERIATLLQDLAAGGGDDVQVRGAGSLAGREFAVSVHGPTHSLVVQADPATIDLVRGIMAEIDRPPERVTVEVGFTEIMLSNNLALSFEALLPLTDPEDVDDLVSAIVMSPTGSVIPGAPLPDGSFAGRIQRTPIQVPIFDPVSGQQIAVIPVPRETAVVVADETEVQARTLMRPRLTLLSGEEHEIFAGLNLPVPTATAGGSGNPLRTSQTVERRDTGIRLRVEPTVPEEGPIALKLDLEVSNLAGNLPGGPTFTDRSLEALVVLESGRSAVIAGAHLPVTSQRMVGVPFLKDIPFLGWLFRSTEDVERKVHLIISVAAVRQHDDAEYLTRWMLNELEREEPTDVAEVE